LNVCYMPIAVGNFDIDVQDVTESGFGLPKASRTKWKLSKVASGEWIERTELGDSLLGNTGSQGLMDGILNTLLSAARDISRYRPGDLGCASNYGGTMT
jgi:hypothetical protein